MEWSKKQNERTLFLFRCFGLCFGLRILSEGFVCPLGLPHSCVHSRVSRIVFTRERSGRFGFATQSNTIQSSSCTDIKSPAYQGKLIKLSRFLCMAFHQVEKDDDDLHRACRKGDFERVRFLVEVCIFFLLTPSSF
jgi:hypothetical protein